MQVLERGHIVLVGQAVHGQHIPNGNFDVRRRRDEEQLGSHSRLAAGALDKVLHGGRHPDGSPTDGRTQPVLAIAAQAIA